MGHILSELYFVTTTVVDWVDIFTRPKYKHIVIDSLAYLCPTVDSLINISDSKTTSLQGASGCSSFSSINSTDF